MSTRLHCCSAGYPSQDYSVSHPHVLLLDFILLQDQSAIHHQQQRCQQNIVAAPQQKAQMIQLQRVPLGAPSWRRGLDLPWLLLSLNSCFEGASPRLKPACVPELVAQWWARRQHRLLLLERQHPFSSGLLHKPETIVLRTAGGHILIYTWTG